MPHRSVFFLSGQLILSKCLNSTTKGNLEGCEWLRLCWGLCKGQELWRILRTVLLFALFSFDQHPPHRMMRNQLLVISLTQVHKVNTCQMRGQSSAGWSTREGSMGKIPGVRKASNSAGALSQLILHCLHDKIETWKNSQWNWKLVYRIPKPSLPSSKIKFCFALSFVSS